MAKRYISPVPRLTPHESEILHVLVEECAEVQKRALKILRFGVTERQPGQPHSNAYRLGLEVGDLFEMIDRAGRLGLIDEEAVEIGREMKKRQLARFLQTTEPQ